MGRTLKRVPHDFIWPLNQVWGGYLNPFNRQSADCPSCEGSGYSPTARKLKDQWYGKAPFRPEDRNSTPFTPSTPAVRSFAERNVNGNPCFYGSGERAVVLEADRLCRFWNSQWCHHLNSGDVAALLAADRLWDFTRVPRTDEQKETVRRKIAEGGNSWLPEGNGYLPTAEEVNIWSIQVFGHDAINCSIVVDAECTRLGITPTCDRCNGEGSIWTSSEAKQQAEEWKPSEPPEGDGFQLWETTSEGSPISPVFQSFDELCDWAAGHATTFGKEKTSAAGWKQMLSNGFVYHKIGNSLLT